MTRLALAAVPFFALASIGFAQAATPATPAAPAHRAHAMHRASPASPEARRETHALNLIEAKGYGEFTNFHADGKNFTASVMSAGKRYTVTVNPDTGQVARQS
jgi:hypothetical protein